MASFLQRLGRTSFRRRRRVLALWLGVLVVLAIVGSAVSKPFSEEFKIPGTGSQQAIDLLKAKLPAASGAAGQVVFAAPSGGRVKDDAASIESAVAAAGKRPASSRSPTRSKRRARSPRTAATRSPRSSSKTNGT
jgi:RND superfamily putative drug exporter